jgi:hypothetical protein
MRIGWSPNIVPTETWRRPFMIAYARHKLHLCRSTLLSILALPFIVTMASASTVTLSIKNDDRQPLRCVVVFAHWVTVDVGPISSGETATVAMTRGPQPGALHIARFDGRPMMIENIVCGTDQDWGASFDQLPLTRVRESVTSTYQIACRAAPRIVCTPSPDFLDEGKRRSTQD